jgi:hypothetical protein
MQGGFLYNYIFAADKFARNKSVPYEGKPELFV